MTMDWQTAREHADGLSKKGDHVGAVDFLASNASNYWNEVGYGRWILRQIEPVNNYELYDYTNNIINEKILPVFAENGYPEVVNKENLLANKIAKTIITLLDIAPKNPISPRLRHRITCFTDKQRECIVSYLFLLLIQRRYMDVIDVVERDSFIISIHPRFSFIAQKSIANVLRKKDGPKDKIPFHIVELVKKLNKDPSLRGKIPELRDLEKLRGLSIPNQSQYPLILRNIVWQAHQRLATHEDREINAAMTMPQSILSLSHEDTFKNFHAAVKGNRPVIGAVSKRAKILIKKGNTAKKESPTTPQQPNPRILILSDNWSFMRSVTDAFQSHSLEVRTLNFGYISSSINSFAERTHRPCSINHHLFVRGRDAISRQKGANILSEAAPLAKDLIDWCDIVFVEWANATAVWCSRYLPDNKKLVIRCHSYESLSHWPVFIDHNRIDKMIFIGDHIRQIYALHLNEFGGFNVEHAVIPNLRKFDKFLSVRQNPARNRMIGLLKYADANKDPLFALDVLQHLLNDSSEWKLKLGGNPFGEIDALSVEEGEYATAFLEKAKKLSENIIFDGFQAEPEKWFAQTGYILSTSRREGSHESVVEGMAAGCVPVLRRWPLVKEFNAPDCVFPGQTSHETPSAAAEYIISTFKNFEQHSNNAREYVRKHFDSERRSSELVDFVRS